MRRLPRVLFLAFVAASFPVVLSAAGPDYFPNYERVRVLGMGGAFTAVADTEDAAFYNPAGLNRLSSWKATILDPTVEASQRIPDIADDFSDVDKDSETEIARFLLRHMNEAAHARVMLTPGFARKNFALFALGNASADVRARNPADPVADVVGVGDVGGQVSGAYGFSNGALQVGATARVIHRWSVVKTYTPAALLDNNFSLDDDAMSGTGITFDLGAIANLPYRPLGFEPSVGIVAIDVGSPGSFGDAIGNTRDIRFGAGLRRNFGIGKLTLAADVRRIGHGGEDFSEKLHVGAEFALRKILSVRAGLYQGNPTAGASLDLWILHLSYATYAVETGPFEGKSADDRRHTAQVALAF